MNSSNRGSRGPLTITETSPVLVSHIPLPPRPSIVYAKFVPTQQLEQHKVVELARQHIVNVGRRKGKGILESLLPVVSVGKEEVALWIFSVHSQVDSLERAAGGKGKQKEHIPVITELETLSFDNLQCCETSHFTPSGLYPCSSGCAKLSAPCSSCTIRAPSNLPTARGEVSTSSCSTTLFPRIFLRPIYALFIEAVRDRLIDDICTIPLGSAKDKGSTTCPHVHGLGHIPSATRLGCGFLCCWDDKLPAWGCGWERRSRNRPLVHTALDIYLSPMALHIRPLPTLTRLLPMPMRCSSSPPHPTNSSPPIDSALSSPPLVPGTPLVLAPYPTPAFYVSTHAGASISYTLRLQFWEALTGLGIFPTLPHTRPSNPTSASSTPKSANAYASHISAEPFVLAFIPLLNPQGESKGITALWPARLAFVDTSPTRFHLTNLPEMPGTETLLTPPRGSGTQSNTPISCHSSAVPLQRRFSSPRSSNSLRRTQRVFRALELTSHKRLPGVPIQGTAKHTAGFVENVAKEREKERERANQERIRRERETKEGKSSSSGVSAPLNPASNVTQARQISGDSAGPEPASPKAASDTVRPGLSWHSVSTTFFAKAAQDSVVHTFYPSPPDWNPISSAQNSSSLEPPNTITTTASTSSPTTAAPLSAISHSQCEPETNHRPLRERLDLSTGIDLGMDIDMNDMSMGINLGNTINILDVNMDTNMDSNGLMDGGFGFTDPFTDDDFNYFDRAPEPIHVVSPDMQRPLHHMSGGEESVVDGWLANELGGSTQDGSTLPPHLQPITPASVGADASTHESLLSHSLGILHMPDDDSELLPPAPDLIPSSPAKSPLSPCSLPTPSLELSVPPASPTGKQMFEPIYFGNRHHVADSKYRDATGKFAFPNTLPRTISPSSMAYNGSPTSSPEKEEGWKLRYAAVTDPRVGVINRLKGVKRKFDGTGHSSKSVDGRLRDEEWESIYDQSEDQDALDDSSSSEEDDAEEPELELEQDDDSSPPSHPSRPNTPPPSGLPLTANLLYVHLQHIHLLPLSTPMRPSFSDLVAINNPSPALISVPTPVSPAAALGGAAERNKTLELLAQAVAKEAVENDIWAQAWGSSLTGSSAASSSRICFGISQADLKYIAELMRGIPGINGPSTLATLLELGTSQSPTYGPTLQMLRQPRFSIGRAGLVHHMLPPAIRFWEKEGLGPRGGTKDVVAFSVFEEGDENSALVEAWMERVGRAYTSRGFGTHVAGRAGAFDRGLVPLQFEAVRKALPNLISSLPAEPQHVVIYIIAPPSVCSSLKSPALRTIIMGQKRVSKLGGQHDFDQDRVLIHFVPDYYIADPYTYPATRHVGLEWFVNSVYDRLLRVTLRQTSRQFWEYNPPFENRFQVPAFILARNTPPKTHLEWDERPSLNVLDRHTFLHVGYRLSKCKKWLLAACIDERGEAHDVAVWGVPNQTDSQALNVNWIVSNIWIFVKQFAQRADTEWRIVVSKLGEIAETEVEVWMSHLETMVSAHSGPPVHVSLVCAQTDIPLPFLCPDDATRITTFSKPGPDVNALFADVSSTTYSAFFPHRTPIISPGLMCPWEHPSLVAPVTPVDEDMDVPFITKSAIGILPLCTSALLRVPNNEDYPNIDTLYIHLIYAYKSAKSTLKQSTHEVHMEITRSWHDLTVLTRERWHFSQQGQLPFHLAALELMSSVLDPEVLTPDAKEMEYLGS